MKRILIILGIVFFTAEGYAQIGNRRRAHKALDEFRKETRRDFNEFRKKCMDDFISFVQNPWKEFENTPPVPMPKEDELPPVVIPKEDKDKPIEDKPVVIDDVVKPVPVPPQPKPVAPIEEVPIEEPRYIDFNLFGTTGRVRFDSSRRVRLQGVEEEQVADAFRQFTPEVYDNLLFDCLEIRTKMQLSDWAYLQFLKTITEKIAGGNNNDAAINFAYLYMQSGYRMRLAHDGNKLYVLFASEHYIYDKLSYTIDGKKYFGVYDLPNRLYISMASFPKEKSLSLLVPKVQRFAMNKGNLRSISSSAFPNVKFSVAVNKNLIDFYNTYPASMLNENFITKWAMYANTPMDGDVKAQAYPELKKLLDGCSQKDAVERLLNLVQTGFIYEYDDKVWGHDRAFFAEESLYYPYCDCEDRSILLTRLVRDLLGLKCILIYYPGHLASAIEFTQGDVKGDYIMLNNHKYIVADGTYINAPLGRTMPGMDNKTATVILLE